MAYPESLHPYLNDTDDTQTWTSTDPNTKQLRVTFDALTSVEDGYDTIHVLDGSDNEIEGPFTGTFLAGRTVLVPGNTVKVRLVSDSSETAWGYATTIEESSEPTVDTGYLVNGGLTLSANTGYTQYPVGPFIFGYNLYFAFKGSNFDLSEEAGVYKSTDAGITWIRQDVANSPSDAPENIVSDGVRYIWMSWKDRSGASDDVLLCRYDTQTDTFGPIIEGGPSCLQVLFTRMLPSGALRVFYYLTGTMTAVYDDGWQAATVIASSTALECATCDSSGVSHVTYRTDAYPSAVYKYVQVALDGTVSSPITVWSQDVPGHYIYNWGEPAFAGTKLLFPIFFIEAELEVPPRRPGWVLVDPYTSASPSITVGEFGNTETLGANEGWAWGVDDQFYYWSLESYIGPWYDGPTSSYPANRIIYYVGDGTTWSQPVLYHDETANPIVADPGPYDPYMVNMSLARLADGGWGWSAEFSIGCTVEEWPGGIYVGRYYLASPGSTTTSTTTTSTTTTSSPPAPEVAISTDCVAEMRKLPGETLYATLNWAPWLATGDAVATSAWALSDGLTEVSSSLTAALAKLTFSGGTAGLDYTIRNTVTTQTGLTEVRSILVKVRRCSTTTTTTTTTSTSTTTRTTTSTTTATTTTT